MNPIVIYQSKYGTTKKYAEWISQGLSCELWERTEIDIQELKKYNPIIYGGGLYAGGVSGLKWLIKNEKMIADKNLILFTCGLADPSDPENTAHIRKSLTKVLTPRMQDTAKIFHLRGGIDYAKLNFTHKSMMAMLYKMSRKKDPETLRNEDRQMLQTYGKRVDFTDQATIHPILEYVNHMEQSKS